MVVASNLAMKYSSLVICAASQKNYPLRMIEEYVSLVAIDCDMSHIAELE